MRHYTLHGLIRNQSIDPCLQKELAKKCHLLILTAMISQAESPRSIVTGKSDLVTKKIVHSDVRRKESLVY